MRWFKTTDDFAQEKDLIALVEAVGVYESDDPMPQVGEEKE